MGLAETVGHPTPSMNGTSFEKQNFNNMQKDDLKNKTPTDANNVLPAVSWYKSLSINQKMALKEVSALICGMNWEDFNILFSPRERLEILHKQINVGRFRCLIAGNVSGLCVVALSRIFAR
jgi:hypothetical protein